MVLSISVNFTIKSNIYLRVGFIPTLFYMSKRMMYLIDKISENFINWLVHINILKPEQYSNYDFWFRIFLFNFIIITSLLTINILLDSLIQLIIISIVVNILRMYTGGLHFTNKIEYCILITIPLITIASLVAKYFQVYYMQLFFIAIFLGVFIIIRVPIMSDEEKENNTDKYFHDRYIYSFLIFYLINCIAITTGLDIGYMVCSCLSVGIILVSLTCFKIKN